MERPSRSYRLAALVAQAKNLLELARPTTACILCVLEALTGNDIDELGKWELDKRKSEAIVDRLTAELGENRQVVWEVLSRCLQLDVWGDYSDRNAAVRQRFLESGEDETRIDSLLGKPPTIYPYLDHFVIGTWQPGEQARRTGFIIEDDRWAAICEGYLVAKGMAFLTDLDLMETSAREEWSNWRSFWKWF